MVQGGPVVLGVGAGIAAYKACGLLRMLSASGLEVDVMPTRESLNFIGTATWAALSGRPVLTSLWDDAHEVPHVKLGREAAGILVAPATADLIAKAAHGRADDLLAATLLTARCPVVFAPAMHTEMWEHPATVANVELLRARGVVVVDPAIGRLTGSDSGPGRLPEPESLFDLFVSALTRGSSTDLTGSRVVVTAGGTREPIDPVRFLGNRSSGRQGYALANAAVARGADVCVVAANVDLPEPAGAQMVRVGSATDLRAATISAAAEADVVVMAAAVSDFRPKDVAESKIKKRGATDVPRIELTRNPDILSELVAVRRSGQVVVGFAAETGDSHAGVLEHAARKLASKGCDLLVVNDVSRGRVFGETDNEVVILRSDGSSESVPRGSKAAVAHAVLDEVVALRG